MGKKRKTIVFIFDYMDTEYQLELVTGVKKRARELDINLFILLNEVAEVSSKKSEKWDQAYRMVSSKAADGVLISSGTLSSFISLKALNDLRDLFGDLPCVSLGIPLNNTPSVLVDNRRGLKELVIHLIAEHKFRDFAFIKGPDNNVEAGERFAVVEDTLAYCNITLHKDLVAEGNFVRYKISYIVDKFLKHKNPPRVIMAANDEMACEVISCLKDKGLRVPEDIAVTGFDNQRISRYTDPNLTTVTNSSSMLGGKGVEVLDRLMGGKKAPLLTLLPSDAVIRESCGCSYFHNRETQRVVYEGQRIFINSGNIDSIVKKNGNEKLFKAVLDVLSREYGFKEELLPLQKILEIFISVIRNHDFWALNSFLDYLLKENQKFERKIQFLYSAFLVFGSILDFQEKGSGVSRSIFHSLFRGNQNILNSLFRFKESREEGLFHDIYIFSYISQTLLLDKNVQHLISTITSMIDKMGTEFYCFTFFDEVNENNYLESVLKILFLYNKEMKIASRAEGLCYPLYKICPENLLPSNSSFAIIIDPIVSDFTPIGYSFFGFPDDKGIVFHIMRRMFVNISLKALIQIKQMNDQAWKLEQANEELKSTLDKLKRAQEHLVQSEKMAALGNLVSGFSHEVNTPIGISVTAASHLQELVDDLTGKFKGNTLKKSDLADFCDQSGETLQMILSNLKQSHKLVRSFKNIAIDQSVEEQRIINVKSYVEDIILSLKPKYKNKGHKIELHCAGALEILCYPGELSQILTNLIMNSIIHGFEERAGGLISIRLKKKGSSMLLEYQDNGKGLDSASASKIYNPFFTTKRGEGGSGLGLYIVYNIVTQRFGGKVVFKTTEGKGLLFKIKWPLVSMGKQKGE